MKVNELMVGDWVNMGNPVTDELVPTKIENIYGDEINCKTGHTSDDVPTILSGKWLRYARPIHLTEEVLMKNGFEKFAESETLFDYTDNDIHLEYWIGDGCFRYYTAEIHYVHQLQHLLRLVGVQNEIEL